MMQIHFTLCTRLIHKYPILASVLGLLFGFTLHQTLQAGIQVKVPVKVVVVQVKVQLQLRVAAARAAATAVAVT